MTEKDYLDWEDLTEEDQQRAEFLLAELHKLFDKYNEPGEEESCENSTLSDEKTRQEFPVQES
jgi:hypothetical protein